MPRTQPPQLHAGQLVRAAREELLGIGAQDFCDLVNALTTKWGRVHLDRSTLWRIENAGVVPTPPRRWAIGEVLGIPAAVIWTTRSSPFAAVAAQHVHSYTKEAA